MAVTFDHLDRLHRIGAKEGEQYGLPPARKLAMTLRPAFMAAPGKTLVWCDWSNIEARVLPWLAMAEDMLDVFRASDADPEMPDIYIATAGPMLGQDPKALWAIYRDPEHPKHTYVSDVVRQAYGKVPVLSLGFGGALGALMAMATAYGVFLEEDTALEIIRRWRASNPWAVDFWGKHNRNGSSGLWGAVNRAMEQPGSVQEVGRVVYTLDDTYMGGTLFCALPCGRLLTYPHIKWEWREVKDKKTGELTDRYQMTFMRAFGRSALWYGKFAENVTQATAASILRAALRLLSREHPDIPVVMHTHDEIVLEVDEGDCERARQVLHACMTTALQSTYPWMAGLPLAAEVSSNWYYTKAL